MLSFKDGEGWRISEIVRGNGGGKSLRDVGRYMLGALSSARLLTGSTGKRYLVLSFQMTKVATLHFHILFELWARRLCSLYNSAQVS